MPESTAAWFTAAVAVWFAGAALTTIPLSASERTRGLADRYALRHIVAGLALFWPAALVWLFFDWPRRERP